MQTENEINSDNKSEFQMEFVPTTLCDLAGSYNH